MEIRTLDSADRHDAAVIIKDAFIKKLAAALEPWEKGVLALADALDSAHALAAYEGDRLLGVAGFRDAAGPFIDLRFSGLRRLYGAPSAMVRLAIMAPLKQSLRAGELAMDGIAVSAEARGKGAGGALLRAIAARAEAHGLAAVTLHVVDGNDGARRLYERFGFIAQPHERIPWPLNRLYGFRGVTPMRLPIADT